MSNKHSNFTYYLNTLTVIPPLKTNLEQVICKADTGASRSYFKQSEKTILHNRKKLLYGPQVNLPDGKTLQALESGTMPLHNLLSLAAKEAKVLTGLSNSSLISIGQLCDDGCVAVFDKTKLRIYKNGQLVLTGTRNWTDGLWDIVIPQPNLHHSVNFITRHDKTKHEQAEYLHKCAFSPMLLTFQRAISKGHFLTWPGITEINFEKFIANAIPTAKEKKKY